MTVSFTNRFLGLLVAAIFLPLMMSAQCETLSIPYLSSVKEGGKLVYQGPQVFGLGWEENGAMAYMVHGVHQSTQTQYSLILVQDMVTDNKIEMLYLDKDVDAAYVHDPCSVMERSDVKEKLKKHKIQSSDLGVFHATRFYTPYQFKLVVEPTRFACSAGEKVDASKYALNFYRGDEFIKTIGSDVGGEEHLNILGYISSPLEDRLAVIVETQMTACGKDKTFADIAIYGCKVN